jgi:DNA-binding NarL/FixJ family response regulator
MRQGLRSILDREEHVEVVGEAASGRAAVDLARTLSPDVVVMDVAMKDLNGIEATRQIRAECPGVKVLALSSHSDSRYVSAILDAGACGYVLKANAYDDLRRALEAARQGKSTRPTSPRRRSGPRWVTGPTIPPLPLLSREGERGR